MITTDPIDQGLEDCFDDDGIIEDDSNIRPCEHCGAPTTFERDNLTQPAEGQNCTACGDWVCDDCTDFFNSCTEKYSDCVCKNCTAK